MLYVNSNFIFFLGFTQLYTILFLKFVDDVEFFGFSIFEGMFGRYKTIKSKERLKQKLQMVISPSRGIEKTRD